MSGVQDILGWGWTLLGGLISGDLGSQITAYAKVLAEETAKGLGDDAAKQSANFLAAKAGKMAVEKSASLWQGVKWAKAERDYRDRLYSHVNTTRLLGHPKPVKIDHLYTDVYVYEKLSAFRRSALNLATPESDPYTFEEPYQRRKALEIVHENQHVYVLGHPGAGKTTFMKYLALLGCRGDIKRTPIYIPLREVAQLKIGIHDYIEREFDICGLPDSKKFVEKLLTNSETLLLIDGLDEVQDEHGPRSNIIIDVNELTRRYPLTQIIVTCRIAASQYAFQQFTYCEVAKFTQEQQKTFISKWYDGDARSSKLLSEWEAPKNAPLRDLGQTPLLLALICMAFDEFGEVPERHVDLYRDSIDALLKKWDTSRNIRRDPFYASLSPYRRELLLQELAAAFHTSNRIIFPTNIASPVIEHWFKKLPDPPPQDLGTCSDLLDQIESQHGLIVQRASGIYSFSHLSLQEFFTARSIAHGHPTNSIEHVVKNHFADPRWREVIVFLAGLLPDGSGLLEQLRGNIARVGADAPVVHRLISCVMTEYLKEEPAWRILKDTPIQSSITYETKHATLRMLANLQRRISEIKWLEPKSGLRLKINIVEKLLLQAENNPKDILKASLYSDELLAYLQGAILTLDCASVAVSDNRIRAVAWIFSPLRS
ncbi:MAG: hypothetical protein C0487_13610 [Leptothrix sp. (in: Bacteria)]|nr:hypothetical protein [Leptothrix sp. (in: b-proteobacteria)]